MTIYQASIIICTRNRAEHLRKCLRALQDLDLPEGNAYELIVVDNGSTDNTAQVVHAFKSRQIRARLLSQPLPGLSHSRNAALAAARGDILLFTDDDIHVPRQWLTAMCEPIVSGAAHAVAGGVVLAQEYLRPWMTPLHHARLAATERLDPAAPCDMVGANMAFSREVLSQIPEFDTEIGSGALGSYEETLFSWQILEAGYRIATAFDFPVEHHFSHQRLLRTSWAAATRKQGRSQAYVEYHWQHLNIDDSRQRELKALLRLAKIRAAKSHANRPIEGMSEIEILCLQECLRWQQWRIEMRRLPNYDLRGLRKRTSPANAG